MTLGHPSLVGHWRFETQYVDGADTKTPDSSGNGNHGTLVGSPTLVTGRVGRGYDFNGTTDYITTGASIVANKPAFSVAVWVKFSNLTPGAAAGEGVMGNFDGSNYSFLLYQLSPTGQIRFVVRTNISTKDVRADISTDWTHYVGVYDGATVKLYINGNLHGSDSLTGDTVAGSNHLWIGQYQVDNSWFDGTIDEPRIYNRALSANEVKQLYYGLPLEFP